MLPTPTSSNLVETMSIPLSLGDAADCWQGFATKINLEMPRNLVISMTTVGLSCFALLEAYFLCWWTSL